MIRLIKLRCEYEFHLDLEQSGPRLGRATARQVIIQRPCRSCSRRRSTHTISRRVYHRWDGNGNRLKDRVIRLIRP